jgi:hypothetical protein
MVIVPDPMYGPMHLMRYLDYLSPKGPTMNHLREPVTSLALPNKMTS